jgi:hypothetical protein
MGVLSLSPPPALVLNAGELNSWLVQLLDALAQSNKDMYPPHYPGPHCCFLSGTSAMLGQHSRQGCCEDLL